MKKNFTHFLIIFLISCSLNDDRPQKAQKDLANKILSQAQGTIKIDKFNKTNGIESEVSGVKIYKLEWTSTLSVLQDFWKAGNAIEGHWNSFSVMLQKPNSGWDSYLAGDLKEYKKGSTIVLFGVTMLEKTENGWRVTETKIGNSQGGQNYSNQTLDPEKQRRKQLEMEDSIRAAEQAHQATLRAMEDSARAMVR